MDFFFLSVQLHFTIDQCKLLHDFSQIAQTNIQPLLHLFNGTLVERVLMFNADEGIIAMSLEMAHQSGPIHLTKASGNANSCRRFRAAGHRSHSI